MAAPVALSTGGDGVSEAEASLRSFEAYLDQLTERVNELQRQVRDGGGGAEELRPTSASVTAVRTLLEAVERCGLDEVGDEEAWGMVAQQLRERRADVPSIAATDGAACRAWYRTVHALQRETQALDEELTRLLVRLDAVPGISREDLSRAIQNHCNAQARRISALLSRRKRLIQRCQALGDGLEQWAQLQGLLPEAVVNGVGEEEAQDEVREA
ncbi:hypothetical protein CDCA_CDCA16G4181 [Cyanidium caldarium]|uniref:Uncharacterized protein n=1 Tax=Cyanidium caldarium TaxID=2771 RepID=A0AAV9J172_CYACA|nr:hypothetical protein CDCA_CDCA16G4181 [Cyanidium caldarium]